MNMSNHDYEEQDFDYRLNAGSGQVPVGRRSGSTNSSGGRRMSYSSASRPAVSHNGMHRRRNKRSVR
jgi:hypothetical protein